MASIVHLIQFIYGTFLLPPGIIIVLLVWCFLKSYRKQQNTAIFLMGITFVFYLLTIPAFSDPLMRSLENKYKPVTPIKGDVIIWLGGGATLDTPNINGKGNVSGEAANRLLTCLQLYRNLHLPMIVSGGQVYQTTGPEARIAKMTLMGAGVPNQKIILEGASLNTTENAKFTKRLLDKYHFRQPILVTSAFHMPRAVRQFTKAGVAVIPYPADYHVNCSTQFDFRLLIPSADALRNASIAIKEYVGLLISGWY